MCTLHQFVPPTKGGGKGKGGEREREKRKMNIWIQKIIYLDAETIFKSSGKYLKEFIMLS